MEKKELITKIMQANPRFVNLEYQPIDNLERIYEYYYKGGLDAFKTQNAVEQHEANRGDESDFRGKTMF